MLTGWLVAALHFVALALGPGAVWVRARALGGPLDEAALRRAFAADSAWGVAGLLWLLTGLARAFGGLEKGTGYYLASGAFRLKLALFVLILLLELWPMVTLIRWRIRRARGQEVDTSRARALAGVSYLQAALVAVIVFAASAMARGLG